jgi:hypothetical protein
MNDSGTTPDTLIVPQAGGFALLNEWDRREVARYAGAADALQDAADRAAAAGGGSVRLVSGTYALDRPVRLGDQVSVVGAGRSTLLLGTGEAALIADTVKGVRVRDLRVRPGAAGCQSGVVFHAVGDGQMEGLITERMGDYGLWVRKNSFLCSLRGCSVAGSGKVGIFLQRLAEGRAGDFIPNAVSDCVVYGGGKGLECERAIVVNITGTLFYQCSGIAIHLHTDSNSVSICGSRSFQIDGDVLVVEKAHELNVSGNIFCWHTGHGIICRDAWWGSIVGNNIIDNGSFNTGARNFTVKQSTLTEKPPAKDGIRLENVRGYTITGNALFNWSVCPAMDTPVREDARCSDNVLLGNTANFYDAAEPAQSLGTRTQRAFNQGWAPGAWNSGGQRPVDEFLQTFRIPVTDRFIDGQLQGPDPVP